MTHTESQGLGRPVRVRRWTEKLAILLLICLVMLWVGAKIHFFMRFGNTTVDGYILEHWPFWAGMTFVGLLLLLLGRIERWKEE
jgi:hypothetical protein